MYCNWGRGAARVVALAGGGEDAIVSVPESFGVPVFWDLIMSTVAVYLSV
jgi:hypothetical protein